MTARQLATGEAAATQGAHVFPFTALVGQEQMKLALILNAINPRVGGVLIRGEKGTAKSTAVRALGNLLPEIEVTQHCPYNCRPGSSCPANHEQGVAAKRPVPIVELPVGATEDRVAGSLDVAGALQEGELRFRPGLLAAANRGILYIDEVNLLNDHLVDVLLDAAAMGRNYVEREGISFQHAAQFLLVGTMNPEEGDLRPQLLDRFALAVDVRGGLEAADRMEVIKRRLAFERDPRRFQLAWRKAETAARRRIARAQRLLPRVRISDEMLRLIANVCADFEVDGLRADIVMSKTAVTLAAYHGRTAVTEQDVRGAAEFALPHRRRRQPFETSGAQQDEIEQAFDRHANGRSTPPADDQGVASNGAESSGERQDSGEAAAERLFEAGSPYKVQRLAAPATRPAVQPAQGRRTKVQVEDGRGRYAGAAEPKGEPRSVAFDATIRAAAMRLAAGHATEPRAGQPRLPLSAHDVREKVFERRSSNLILFAVDASGSMAAMSRMAAAKGAVLSLLLDAYQKRDAVGFIAFRGRQSELLLPPTRSVELAERALRQLPTGGRTPLSSALQLAHATVKRHSILHREAMPLFVLVSDGRPNVAAAAGDPFQEALAAGRLFARDHIASVVVDTEPDSGPRVGLSHQLAQVMEGQYLRLRDLEAGSLASVVRRRLGRPN